MQNTVTLKKIALKLDVSVSTVSKALNDSYEISSSTKKRIVSVAKELNYKPNFYAKSLKKRDKFIFGVILPNLNEKFYLDVLAGITEESFKRGHLIMMYNTSNKLENEVNYTELLSEDIIDGLIFSSTYKKGKNKCIQKLIQNKILPVEIIENNTLLLNSKLLNNPSLKGIELGKYMIKNMINKVKH